MSRKSASILAAAALATFASAAGAQVTVDGTVTTGEYGAPLALQTTQTGYGNNFSELDGAYANYTVGGAAELAITGNLEGNSNGFVIFLDRKSGGAIANTAGGGFNQFGSIGGIANCFRSEGELVLSAR